MSVTNNPSLALLSIVMSSVIQARQRLFFRTRQYGDKQTVREKEKKKKKKTHHGLLIHSFTMSC